MSDNISKLAPELLGYIEREVAWLSHIKDQITAPKSVILGIEQSIRAGQHLISKTKGE